MTELDKQQQPLAQEYLEGVPAADRPFVELFLQTQMVSALLGS